MSQLFASIAALGCDMAGEEIDALADKLEALGSEPASDSDLRAIARGVSHRAMNERVRELFRVWRGEHADVPPVAMAWALRSARATDERHRERERIQLVWTDPRHQPTSSRFRRIDQALLELIEAAEDSIVIVSYATYRVPDVQNALLAKHERVRITFIVETEDASDGEYRGDPRRGIGRVLAARATVLTWPLERRDRRDGQSPGALHAKCALADDRLLLVSSANLTERALARNVELGLLIEGGEMPRQLARHLEALRTHGFFQPVAR